MSSAYSAEELKNKTNDWLLEKRGSGEKLNADTHSVIESEMIRRGMAVPPIPEHPVRISEYSRAKSSALILVSGLLITIMFVALFKFIGLIALVVCFIAQAAVFAYLAYLKVPPNNLPDDATRSLRKGLKDNVTELMITAGVGDIKRLGDLLNYGAPINHTTKSGLTALMYAAANNQVDAYKFLISRGADASIRSSRGLTAQDIATEKGFGNFAP